MCNRLISVLILINREKLIAMSHCDDNLPGPGGAGGQRVSNDPPESERADLTATNGHKASAIDGRLGDGVSGAEGGVEREEGRREGCWEGR